MARKQSIDDGHGFVQGLRLERDRVLSFDSYPFSIPAIRELSELAYEETEHYSITRDFLAAPERFLKHLFSTDS